MKKYSLHLVVLTILVIIGVVALSGGRFAAHAASPSGPLTGYAWSSNIGWVQFSTGVANPVTADSSGNLTGYAWSSNIGWVQFGGLSSFPTNGTAAGNATVNFSTGAVNGWAKALSADGNGWDGWIELSGANHPSPGSGVTMDPSTGIFSGYAWGATNVGWLQFNPTLTVTQNVNCVGCANNTPSSALVVTLTANNQLSLLGTNAVATGTAVTLNWTIQNASTTKSCTSTGQWGSIDTSSINTVKPSVSGSGQITFGTADVTGTISGGAYTSNNSTDSPHIFTITCDPAIGSTQVSSSVSIDVAQFNSPPGGLPAGACPTLAHATLCHSGNNGTTISSVSNNQSQCPSENDSLCQYFCNTPGYTAKGNSCSKSTTIEIP